MTYKIYNIKTHKVKFENIKLQERAVTASQGCIYQRYTEVQKWAVLDVDIKEMKKYKMSSLGCRYQGDKVQEWAIWDVDIKKMKKYKNEQSGMHISKTYRSTKMSSLDIHIRDKEVQDEQSGMSITRYQRDKEVQEWAIWDVDIKELKKYNNEQCWMYITKTYRSTRMSSLDIDIKEIQKYKMSSLGCRYQSDKEVQEWAI